MREQWYQVIGVRSGTTLKIYLNGVYEGTATIPSNAIRSTGAVPLTIGWGVSGNPYAHDGFIDEVALWERAITDGSVSVGQTAGGEVAELWSGGAGIEVGAASNSIQPTSSRRLYIMYTLQTIKKSVMDIIGEDSITPTYWTSSNDIELENYINDAFEEVCILTRHYKEDLYIPLMANKKHYRISGGKVGQFLFLSSVRVLSNNDNLYMTDPFQLSETRLKVDDVSGTPRFSTWLVLIA